MAEDRLFKTLCSSDVMRVGWHLAQADSRDDFVIDPIGHADFAHNLEARLNHVIQQIENHRYRPCCLLEIDIPKSGLSVRPGNVLPIEEATLLHGIVYLLAPILDRKLDKAVYSYRLSSDWKKRVKKRDSLFREAEVAFPFLKGRTIRSISPFDAWYELWPEFEADAIEACTKEGYTHLTKTDISAYFENIDLRLLETHVRTLLKREENKLLNLLFRVMDGWTRVTSTGTPVGRGIPQGNEISSFFGNLYLVPLDRALTRFCRSHDAKWFRYLDDVKIFSKSDRDAREVVFIVNDALRSLHLNLQGSKTEILSGEGLIADLDDSDTKDVGKVYDAVRKLDGKKDAKAITAELKPLKELVSRFRSRLPESVAKLSGKQSRLFRRLLTLYGYCGRPHFRRAAVVALKQLPDYRILQKTLAYLRQLDYRSHDKIVSELLAMVETDELPFPYQAATVLEAVARLHPQNPRDVASRIRKYALEKRRHWMVFQKGLEALFFYPYAPDNAERLAIKFFKEDHPLVRRAACLLLLRGRKHVVREQLSELIYHADPNLSKIALYFLRFVHDNDFAAAEITQMRKGSRTDVAFHYALPRLYALAATPEKRTAEATLNYLDSLPPSRSKKIMWHRGHLRSLLEWSTRLPVSPAPSATTPT